MGIDKEIRLSHDAALLTLLLYTVFRREQIHMQNFTLQHMHVLTQRIKPAYIRSVCLLASKTGREYIYYKALIDSSDMNVHYSHILINYIFVIRKIKLRRDVPLNHLDGLQILQR